MRAFIEKLWQRFLFRPAHVHGFAIYDLRNVRRLIVHVANQDCLRRADDNARRLQSDIDAMGAEVAFLSRVIFGIDKDRVVRTGGHAGFTADADRFIKVDYPVGPLEHRRRRACRHARRVRALIAPRHLMRAAHLRKHADIDMLDVSTRHAYGNDIFRFAGCRAGMTTDTTGVIDHLGPLNTAIASWLFLDHCFVFGGRNISRTWPLRRRSQYHPA